MIVSSMRKILFYFLIASIYCCKNEHVQIKTGLEGKLMPSFNLLLMDSTTKLNTQNIPVGESIVLFYFSPKCPYCKAQTEDLIEDIKSLKHIRFYLISNFPFEDIQKYCTRYHLEKYSNIIVASDYEMFFNQYFKAEGLPYLAIYDSDKKLKQVLLGQVKTNLIKNILQK